MVWSEVWEKIFTMQLLPTTCSYMLSFLEAYSNMRQSKFWPLVSRSLGQVARAVTCEAQMFYNSLGISWLGKKLRTS